jgi:hypothetical protein
LFNWRLTEEERYGDPTLVRLEAAFWLVPVELGYNDGYAEREINRIRRLVLAYEAELLRRWNEFFGE